MEIIRGQHNLRERHRGCVLTIGNFDGLHLGHQALIAQARGQAQALGLPLTVLTFEPAPREYFTPADAPGRVLGFRSRMALLQRYGVERVLIQRFDRRFAAMSAQDFVEQLLVRKLDARAVVVGDDFCFGAQRAGNFALLQAQGDALGFKALGLSTVALGDARCSSTRLRAALSVPDLEQVGQLLDRPYALLGRVRQGLRLGRTLGMPTTNMYFHRTLALRQGIYVVRAQVAGRRWQGVASYGVRPTLGLTRCLLETHLFGEPGEIYGEVIEVEFCRWLRAELKFDSLDALSAQMHRDAADARAYFRENPA
jgi:riboflavin kinase/FMN adenylyltransferase